jgi:hypothetical protein
MVRVSVLALVVFSLLCPQKAAGGPIFASALLGDTGVSSGSSVWRGQFLAARFELTRAVETETVGGHFFTGSGTIFAAIVALDGETDFPDSTDLSSSDVLGATLLAPPLPSNDVFAPLRLQLSPGWYAVVFGGLLFGSTSAAAGAPAGNPLMGTPSFFLYDSVTPWRDLNTGNDSNGYRFVVTGRAAPVPDSGSSALMTMLSVTAIAALRWRARHAAS